MFMVLSSWQSHCESSPGLFDECRTAPSGRRLKTKPDDIGCESACTGCRNLHPPSPFIITTQRESWYSFYRTTEGRRLSRPSWLVTYRDGLPVHRRSPINVMIPELRVTLQGAATGRIQRHIIPEPRITLQGAATCWIHCHVSRATCHIAGCSHLAKAMSWGWKGTIECQGQGFVLVLDSNCRPTTHRLLTNSRMWPTNDITTRSFAICGSH